MDEVDLAQQINEEHLADSLARFQRDYPRPVGHPLLIQEGAGGVVCIDCEEIIPEARRKAMPGCTRCRDCQELHENWRTT